MDSISDPRAERIAQLLADGNTYESAAEALRSEGIDENATRDSVRGIARRRGLNARGREPMPVTIPKGIAGGTRFKRYEVPIRSGDRIAVISDTQIPFHDEKSLAAVERFLDDYQPNALVLNGDILDFYTLSTFTHNPAHASNLQHELDVADEIFGRWARRHERAQKVWVLGNHEDRLRKYMWEHPGFASLRMLDFDTLLSQNGAWTILPYGSQAKIGDTLIVHGDKVRSQSGASARAQYASLGMSVIMGHTHRLSQASDRNARGQHTMIEGGCLCRLDPEYGPFPNWTQGITLGFVNNGVVHWQTVPILEDGFRADGRFYKRER